MKTSRLLALALATMLLVGAGNRVFAQEVLFDFGDGVNASGNNDTPDQLANFAIDENQAFGAAPGNVSQTIDGVQMTITPIIATGADFGLSTWGSNSQGIGIRSNTETGNDSTNRRVDGGIGEAIHFSFDVDLTITSISLGSFGNGEVATIGFVSGTDPFGGGAGFTLTGEANGGPAFDDPVNVFVSAGTVLSYSATTATGGGVLWNDLHAFVGTPPEPLTLQVNTGTGELSLLNGGIDPVDIDYLRIASLDAELDGGSLAAGSYTGLAGAAGFPAGSNDGTGWESADENDDLEIIESFLTGMSTIPDDDQPISLGNAFVNGGTQDLSFTYHVAGDAAVETTGLIEYITPAGTPGDFNGDGIVSAADYTTWRDNLGGSSALDNDNGLGTPISSAHYDLWKANFGNSGAGALSATQAVPEPAAIALLLACALPMAGYRRVWLKR